MTKQELIEKNKILEEHVEELKQDSERRRKGLVHEEFSMAQKFTLIILSDNEINNDDIKIIVDDDVYDYSYCLTKMFKNDGRVDLCEEDE